MHALLTNSLSRPLRVAFFVCVAVAIIYAPGFDGFWHGDDLSNLHRAHMLSQQGTLWPDTLRLFAEPVPSEGAFYRPMMMLSMALNYALANAHYAGWYLVNFAVHLSNTFLVALLVRRFADRVGCDATVAAPLAALLFGLCPSIAEGVYWMSARSDGWVTLLTLAGVYLWAGSTASTASRTALVLPLLLIAALGFKESAAVLPLQMLLLAVAWPGALSRQQRWALVGALGAVVLFMAWRAFLFGNAWQVYTHGAGGGVALHIKFWHSLQSLGPWWTALTASTPAWSIAYLICLCVALLLGAMSRPLPQWRLAFALAAASGGLAVATLLNLGGMSSNGEGGRLTYGPVAWLMIAVGVFVSHPKSLVARASRWPQAATAALSLALLSGFVVLWGHLGAAWSAQAGMRMITQSIPPWVASHAGLTMLLVPDHDGPVVIGRNAQGGIVLEPIQQEPYLHRVLPTLAAETQLRQEQFCSGMAQRLEIVRPRLADARTLAALAERADAVWPKHVACWSKSKREIVTLLAPPMDASCDAWLASIRTDVKNCER